MAKKRFLVDVDREQQTHIDTQFEQNTTSFDGHETRSLAERFVQLLGVVKSYMFRGDSIDLLGDVDTTTIVSTTDSYLKFDGSNWVPTDVYGTFVIWAEESATLNTGGVQEWAFGNGDNTPVGHGIPVAFDCELIAMTLNIENTGSATVRIVRNSQTGLTAYQVAGSGPSTVQNFATPLAFAAGDVVNFRTITEAGATTSGRVAAWFRYKL